MSTALDIISNALKEIGAYAPGESVPSAEAFDCLTRLNILLDHYDTRRLLIYNVNFNSYTLIPNHQPHTIGRGTLPNSSLPSADFFADRPVKIENANLVLTDSSPPVKVPMNLRNDDWWAAQSVPAVTSNIPTDLYYSPTDPNGSLYIWPVPTFAYDLELETWQMLQSFATLQTRLSAPPGYERAITLNLALELAPMFGATPSGVTAKNAKDALASIQSVNSTAPLQRTDVPGPRETPYFNYLTGGVVSRNG
jgi:hypothetical protein